jgi:hypothetical protein
LNCWSLFPKMGCAVSFSPCLHFAASDSNSFLPDFDVLWFFVVVVVCTHVATLLSSRVDHC